jgi:hypothetical protein
MGSTGIAERMRMLAGTYTMESVPGKGTTIRIDARVIGRLAVTISQHLSFNLHVDEGGV